jgi:hypothetical protein
MHIALPELMPAAFLKAKSLPTLPVQQAIPPNLLALADEVIE